MKTNGYRIGNLVYGIAEYENGKKIDVLCRLTALDEHGNLGDGAFCMLEPIEGYPFEFEYYEDIKDVRLTEEWLVKFGFEKDNETYSWSKIIEDESRQICVEIDCLPNKKGFWYLKKIEFVHQLQNLYFGLIGEDLTIKAESAK